MKTIFTPFKPVVLSFFFLLFAFEAQASFSLKVDFPKNTTEEQKKAFLEKLKELETKIPSAYKSRMNRPITLKFRPESEKGGKSCPEMSKPVGTFLGGKRNASTIEMDQSLLSMNNISSFFAFGGDCSPAGAVIQSLSKIYDSNIILTAEEESLYRRCEDSEFRNSERKCSYVQHLIGDVSSRPQFQKLRNWDSDSSSKGDMVERSPDLSEYVSAQNAFAVNMQLFLSDPNFACRRPATAQFLRETFKHEAFPKDSCKMNQTLYTPNIPDPITIDPAKVYQVHYLWAGPGEAMMSRWGHSMVRIVQCAPHRTVVDEKCLEDKDHHAVVSYRAYVDELAIDNWKGLTGAYPSQMMIMRLKDVIDEYTLTEQRDLFSVPLKLDESQKEMLLNNVIEQYWGYRGKYKFLSTNCATETKDLIQSVDRGGVLSSFNTDDTLTPSYLFDSLQDKGLAQDIRKMDRKALAKKGLLFEADATFLRKPYAKLREKLPQAPEKLEDFYSKLGPQERMNFFEKLPAEDQKKHAAVFYLLEANAKQLRQQSIDKALFKLLMDYKEDKNHPLNKKIINYQERLKQYSDAMQPWNIVRPGEGYGIPFPHELVAENPVEKPMDDRFKLVMELQKIIPDLMPKEWDELQAIRKNMDSYKFVAKQKKLQQNIAQTNGTTTVSNGSANGNGSVLQGAYEPKQESSTDTGADRQPATTQQGAQ